MKLLTKNTDYAVRALFILVGEEGRYVSTKDISKQQKIPYEYLRKILRMLVRELLVEAKEGSSGGFRLKVEPKQISLIDIVKIFQGDLKLSECMFRKKLCHNIKKCVLRKNIQRIEQMVEKEFKGITLDGLLTDMKKERF